MDESGQSPLNEQHPFHDLVLSWGATPRLTIAGELYYDTKGMFPKHNLGRDIERYCDERDWFKSNKRFYVNARGVVALGFGKRIYQVRETVYSLLGLSNRPDPSIPRVPAPAHLPFDQQGPRPLSPFGVAGTDEETSSRPGSAISEVNQMGDLQVHLPQTRADVGEEEDPETVIPTPTSSRSQSDLPLPPPMRPALYILPSQLWGYGPSDEDPLHPDYVEEELADLKEQTDQYHSQHSPRHLMTFDASPSASNAYITPVPSRIHPLKRPIEDYISADQYNEEPVYKIPRIQYNSSY